jgi:hypothetical protein
MTHHLQATYGHPRHRVRPRPQHRLVRPRDRRPDAQHRRQLRPDLPERLLQQHLRIATNRCTGATVRWRHAHRRAVCLQRGTKLFTAVDAAMLRLATQPVSSGGQHGWPDLNAPPASQVNQWKSWMEGVWADTVSQKRSRQPVRTWLVASRQSSLGVSIACSLLVCKRTEPLAASGMKRRSSSAMPCAAA